jgi:uncharacterized membrane protein (DUF441 family)
MNPYFLGWLIMCGSVFIVGLLLIGFTKKFEEIILALIVFLLVDLFGLIDTFEFTGVGGTIVSVTTGVEEHGH